MAGLDAGLRSLSSGLGPPTLESHGLAAALLQLGGDAIVDIRVDVDTGDLPDHLAAAIYFICAEAISNALKHTSASSITVHVRLRISECPWRSSTTDRVVPTPREDPDCKGSSIGRRPLAEPGDRKPAKRWHKDHRRLLPIG